MAGIIFFRTKDLEAMKEFYHSRIGMTTWLVQSECVILKHGNLLLGFCEREETDSQGIITFFYQGCEDVDEMYRKLQPLAIDEPKENETYGIYHFFIKDPDDRLVEFQAFLYPLDPYLAGDELLLTRRSIREFQDTVIPDELLWKLFEICRFAPTSRNCQSYRFIVIRDRKVLRFLAGLRGGSSAPIARAPMAVAICTDPGITGRPVQDGCIAAYHFTLAAKLSGLGTCWIAAMDRTDVKEALGIPQEHYIATITPLGYPAERPQAPPRKPANELVHFFD